MPSVILTHVVNIQPVPVLASVLLQKQNVVLEVQHAKTLHAVVVNQVKLNALKNLKILSPSGNETILISQSCYF